MLICHFFSDQSLRKQRDVFFNEFIPVKGHAWLEVFRSDVPNLEWLLVGPLKLARKNWTNFRSGGGFSFKSRTRIYFLEEWFTVRIVTFFGFVCGFLFVQKWERICVIQLAEWKVWPQSWRYLLSVECPRPSLEQKLIAAKSWVQCGKTCCSRKRRNWSCIKKTIVCGLAELKVITKQLSVSSNVARVDDKPLLFAC